MFKLVGTDGREYGPVPAETIRQWIAEGRVNADTKLQRDGTTGWQPLREVNEFAANAVAPPPLPRTPAAPDSGLNKIIPYRNVPALVAYYCAVFSLIPFLGLLLGFAALALGLVGLRTAARNPAAGGRVHSWIGIILGGLCGFGNLAFVVAMIVMASRH